MGGALLDGSSKFNTGILIDSAPTEKMTVEFFNTNADRTLSVGSSLTSLTAGSVKTSVASISGTNVGYLCTETFTVTKGSNVYIGATASGIWISKITFEE